MLLPAVLWGVVWLFVGLLTGLSLEEHRFWSRRTTRGAIITIFVLVSIGTISYLSWPSPPNDPTPEYWIDNLQPNEWGDLFAGTFAALAFLWLVLGYMQQAEELGRFTALQERHARAAENALRIESSREIPQFSVETVGMTAGWQVYAVSNTGGIARDVMVSILSARGQQPLRRDALGSMPRGSRKSVNVNIEWVQQFSELCLQIDCCDQEGTSLQSVLSRVD
jgi:hypothetical protein